MVKQYLQLEGKFLCLVKLDAGCYNTAFWQGSLNGPCLYLQVLSDSGMDRTLPQKWPEERGKTALSSPSASVYALDQKQKPEVILNKAWLCEEWRRGWKCLRPARQAHCPALCTAPHPSKPSDTVIVLQAKPFSMCGLQNWPTDEEAEVVAVLSFVQAVCST